MKLEALKIIRPGNCIFAFVLTLFAYSIGIGNIGINFIAILAGLVVFLVCAGGNAMNDFFDYEIDKKNKLYRPIPKKLISRTEALAFAILLFASGIILSTLINNNVFAVAIVAVSLLVAYTSQGRYLGISGDIMVSLLTALVFILGGFAATPTLPYSILLIAAAAFTINVAREIVKDIEDYNADKGLKITFPLQVGKNIAAATAIIFLILNLFVVYLLLPIYATGLIFLFSLPIIAFIFYKSLEIVKNQNADKARNVQKILKLAMIIEFIFFFVDQFVINISI